MDFKWAGVGIFICTIFLNSEEIVTIDDIIDGIRDMCVFQGVLITCDYVRHVFIFRSVCPRT